jgi:hypothetical protein
MSIVLPLLVKWTMSNISSICPNECLFTKRCWGNFDLLFPYLMSHACVDVAEGDQTYFFREL